MAISCKFTHLLAVSGGADSMSMLHMMKDTPGIMVAHVNHQIRPDSHMDARLVDDFCTSQGIPCVHQVLMNPPSTGIEAWARQRRYEFFHSVMRLKNIPVLVTAHNANDQAETIIMRIIRGTGIKGLRGIHETNPALHRPLLGMTKPEIYEYCHTNNVPYREDSTNTDTKYFRNRVRHTMMDGVDIKLMCRIATLAESVYPKVMRVANGLYDPFVTKTTTRITITGTPAFDDLGYMYFSELFSDWFPLTASIYERLRSTNSNTRKFNITKSIICTKYDTKIEITKTIV